jgi:hypothetical protein
MRIRTVCMALLVLALAGCSLLHPRVERAAKKLECDGSRDCTVAVTATCSHFYGCDLATEYDLVLVSSPRDKPVDIRWQLAGETGAEFTSDGISFEHSMFDCRQEDPRTFACTDRNTEFGVFKYAVHLTVKGSAFGPRGVQSLDPWVVNR